MGIQKSYQFRMSKGIGISGHLIISRLTFGRLLRRENFLLQYLVSEKAPLYKVSQENARNEKQSAQLRWKVRVRFRSRSSSSILYLDAEAQGSERHDLPNSWVFGYKTWPGRNDPGESQAKRAVRPRRWRRKNHADGGRVQIGAIERQTWFPEGMIQYNHRIFVPSST